MRRLRHAPPGRLIDIGGRRLHVIDQGVGAPVAVFDAALGASSLSWSLVQPEVARTTRTCAYDRAGFGWSDAGPLPRTAGRCADELFDVLERAEIPPPYVLVGHSFGALTMRVFAARHRDAVAGLVFVDPAHPEEWLDPDEARRSQIARGVRLCRYGERAAQTGVARLVATLVAAGALSVARGLVGLIGRGDLSRSDEEILAPIWKLPPAARQPLRHFWTERKFFAALGSQIGAIRETAAEVRDAGVEAFAGLPLIVMSAATTSTRRARLHEALARTSSRGRHIVARRSGHWIPLDEPAAVVDAILEVVTLSR